MSISRDSNLERESYTHKQSYLLQLQTQNISLDSIPLPGIQVQD